MAKRECPITRQQFMQKAPDIKIVIDGKEFTLEPRAFKTDSLGWNLSGKKTVEIDGTECPVQIGLNVTLIGSKELD